MLSSSCSRKTARFISNHRKPLDPFIAQTPTAMSLTKLSTTCNIQNRYFSDADGPKTKQQKVKKKAKNSKKVTDSGRDRLTEIMIKAIDARPRTPPEPSDEEKRRRHEIGRNYVIGQFQRHNEIDHDLACKLRLKNHALKMLPRDSWLKEQALKLDMGEESLPPIYRPIPVDTPPIPEFNSKNFMAKDS